MNGYKNHETHCLALWLHNDEYLNNEFLPILLQRNNDCKYQAGEDLKDIFEEEENSIIAEFLGKKNWNILAKDVGSFWRVEWHELF